MEKILNPYRLRLSNEEAIILTNGTDPKIIVAKPGGVYGIKHLKLPQDIVTYLLNEVARAEVSFDMDHDIGESTPIMLPGYKYPYPNIISMRKRAAIVELLNNNKLPDDVATLINQNVLIFTDSGRCITMLDGTTILLNKPENHSQIQRIYYQGIKGSVCNVTGISVLYNKQQEDFIVADHLGTLTDAPPKLNDRIAGGFPTLDLINGGFVKPSNGLVTIEVYRLNQNGEIKLIGGQIIAESVTGHKGYFSSNPVNNLWQRRFDLGIFPRDL